MARTIGVADCETNPFEHGAVITPFIWGLMLPDEYHQFNSTIEFVEFLKDKEYIIYAHNGGKFDWHFILEYANQFEPINIINGRIAKFKIGACEFRDSFNLFPMPLKAYQKDDFDYNILRPELRDKPKNRKKIERYLYNDCQYLFDMVDKFIEDFGLKLTIAGSAMSQWEKIDGKAPKTTTSYFAEMSEFYFGGRVQAFKTGNYYKKFKFIDINSAYPYAMLFNHPYGGDFILKKFDGKIKEQNFYEVKARGIGILPIRAKRELKIEQNGEIVTISKGALYFPNDGEYYYFNANGWEFKLYSEFSSDFSVLAEYSALGFRNFSEYINKWYELKENSDKKSLDYIFAKLMMNSLYGKFGANPDKYTEYELIPTNCVEQHEENTEFEFCSTLANHALMEKPLTPARMRYYDVATASSITGFVRAYLYRAINAIEKQGGEVYYCDTDSILFTGDVPDGIDFNTELGGWDVEAEPTEAHIAGKKLYAMYPDDKGKWKTATKGVRLTHKDIKRIAEGETIEWKSEAPTFSLKRGVFYQERKIKKT